MDSVDTPTTPVGFWRGRPVSFVFSCEHGGYQVPQEFESLMGGAREALASHRGYDPGALALARALSSHWKAPLIYSEVTRLLVELNRSTHHKNWLSEWSRGMSPAQKERLLESLYRPYREAVMKEVERVIDSGAVCLHGSVHSFTPVYHGVPRKTEVGLLYDPRRPLELEFCKAWARRLRGLKRWNVRRNHPYLGAADGLTSALRKKYRVNDYVGVEIEVKNDLLVGAAVEEIARQLGRTLASALEGLGREEGKSS